MSHDNITDTYTYLRLCSAQHNLKYPKMSRSYRSTILNLPT